MSYRDAPVRIKTKMCNLWCHFLRWSESLKRRMPQLWHSKRELHSSIFRPKEILNNFVEIVFNIPGAATWSSWPGNHLKCLRNKLSSFGLNQGLSKPLARERHRPQPFTKPIRLRMQY